MLKSQYRLLTPLPKGSRFVYSASFSLKFCQNTLEKSRFGFIISKKTAKGAVDRNRSKRLFRSVIEDQIGQIRKGYDMLFIIKQAAESKTLYSEEIKNLLTKNNLWESQK